MKLRACRSGWTFLLAALLAGAVTLCPAIAGAQARGPGAPADGLRNLERAKKLAEEAIRKSQEAQAVARDVSRAADAMKLAEEARSLAEQASRLIEAASLRPPAPVTAPPAPPAAWPAAAQATPAPAAAQVAPSAPVAPPPPPKAPPRPESLGFTFNYRVRGWLQGNFDLDRRTDGDNENSFFDHRPRIRIDAGYRPFDLTILMEKGDTARDFRKVNPDRESSVVEEWGTNTLVPTNVRWAYLQYTGPVAARVGRQLVELGHSIVLQGDMDTLKLEKPLSLADIGSITLGASYSKFPFVVPDGTSKVNDTDLDGWMGGADFRPFKLVRGLRLRPFFYKVVDLSRGTSTSRPFDFNLDRDGNPNTFPRDGRLEPLWLALAIDGRHGPFEYWLEGIKMTGSATRSRDFDAHAVVGSASYRLGRATVQLWAGFGSGAGGRGATNELGDFNDFLGAFLCKERFEHGVLFGEDINGGFGFFQSNLANITFVRPRVEIAPWKDFTIGVSYSYLRTTASVYEGVGPQGFFGAPVSRDRTSDVGHDVGFETSYRIARPFSIFGRFGYFLPGDAYRLPGGRSADPAYEVMFGTEFNLGLKVF